MSSVGNTFTHQTRETILNEYVTRLLRACRILGVPKHSVSYSEPELRGALDEADVDLKAMFDRRSRADGISPGKVAGIVAYRLSRYKIVHIAEDAQAFKGTFLVQDVAALLLVEAHLLRVAYPPRMLLELAYQMARRHANQETLGVVFDMLLKE